MSSSAVLFYGVTSQDDSDGIAEVCRRLELIADSQVADDGVDHILKTYLRPMNLDFGIHGSSRYPIVFFYPFDESNRWYKETLMRYFAEINPAEMKVPSRNIVQALEEIAEKLGYWGPNWKLVTLLDV